MKQRKRRHSLVRQSLRDRLMKDYIDRRIEERRKSNTDDRKAKLQEEHKNVYVKERNRFYQKQSLHG